MNSFQQTNLQNIQRIFQEKTGVDLNASRRRRRPIGKTVVLAAVLAGCLTMTAGADRLFSDLSGDELRLSAFYEGDGVVSVSVENQSDKDLNFQSQLKLMRWSTGEKIQPLSDDCTFSGTEIKAHTNGTMTIDLSQAYDMAVLEQPLTDDHYYLVLTNNNFVFGQDWMCTVFFSEPIETVVEEPVPITPVEADRELVAQVMEELHPYFEQYHTDHIQRRNLASAYLAKCQELLGNLQGKVAVPQSPMFMVDGKDADVVFDETAPLETQHWLTGQNWHTLDGYGIPVGAGETESALVLSAIVPQHKGETDGGVAIPLIYLFAYDVNDAEDPLNCAFIHGRLMTFAELEPYKVYQDDQYVFYEVTELFYTELRQHMESMLSQRSDVYFDEQIWKRVQNIYQYYKEIIRMEGAIMPIENRGQ